MIESKASQDLIMVSLNHNTIALHGQMLLVGPCNLFSYHGMIGKLLASYFLKVTLSMASDRDFYVVIHFDAKSHTLWQVIAFSLETV